MLPSPGREAVDHTHQRFLLARAQRASPSITTTSRSVTHHIRRLDCRPEPAAELRLPDGPAWHFGAWQVGVGSCEHTSVIEGRKWPALQFSLKRITICGTWFTRAQPQKDSRCLTLRRFSVLLGSGMHAMTSAACCCSKVDRFCRCLKARAARSMFSWRRFAMTVGTLARYCCYGSRSSSDPLPIGRWATRESRWESLRTRPASTTSFSDQRSFADLDSAKVRSLLELFRSGSFRQRLHRNRCSRASIYSQRLKPHGLERLAESRYVRNSDRRGSSDAVAAAPACCARARRRRDALRVGAGDHRGVGLCRATRRSPAVVMPAARDPPCRRMRVVH